MTTPGPPPDPWQPPAAPWPGGPPPVPPAGFPPPPYGYPAQPYWPGYQPAPPQRSTRRWLPWVIVAAFLLVGGCAAVVGTLGVREFRVLDGSRVAVDDYLDAVEQGDGAGAQALLCDEASPDTVQQSLTEGITAHHVVGVSVNSGFGEHRPARTTGTVTTDVTVRDGVHLREIFDVAREHDRWLVCGIRHY